jgi:hypothetical protein
MTDRDLIQQALDALEESVDTVRHEYETDWRHKMPTRKAQLAGMKAGLDAHIAAIASLRERLAHCDRCGKKLGGEGDIHTCTPREQKRFEQWWDAGDDIPNDAPYTPDTPIQFAWAGWQAALAQPEQEPDPIGDAQDRLIAEMAAQPEQEPVAWVCYGAPGHRDIDFEEADINGLPIGTPLYTTPPAAALQEKEPVAWVSAVTGDLTVRDMSHTVSWAPLCKCTAPPAAQRTWVGLDWLPEHKCGLHLSHNEHRDVYETVEQFYESDDFISEEEWHKAVAENSVWVLHWYPNTPIGFTRIAASTLEALETALKKEKNT